MQTIIQILKVNEARSGNKDGRDWSMQDCECILLNDDGSVGEVGVCALPKDLIGKVAPGHYTASFTLAANGFQHIDIADGVRCSNGIYLSATAAVQGHVRVG